MPGRIISLCFLMLVACSAWATKSSLEAEDFVRLPDIQNLRLSPDGNRVVYISRPSQGDQEGFFIVSLDLASDKKTIVLRGTQDEFRITKLSWAGDSHLFVHVNLPAMRNGTETIESRLIIVDVDKQTQKWAIPYLRREGFIHLPQFSDQIIDTLPDDPDHYLLQIDNDYATEPRVYKMSLTNKSMQRFHNRSKNISSWMTDQQHDVRLGIYLSGTRYKIEFIDPETEGIRTLWSFEAFTKDEIWPLGFAESPYKLYVSKYYKGNKAIYLANLEGEEISFELIHSNPGSDVIGDLFLAPDGKAVGIETTDGYVFWEPSYQALINGLDQALPETTNYIVSFSRDERRYVLFSTSDVDPGTYYLGDRDHKSLTPIAYRYQRLLPKQLSEKQKVSFSARDGVAINAQLSMPHISKANSKYPTIIVPEGSPVNYGTNFDYRTQFFTHLGFAVLHINSRDSKGDSYNFVRDAETLNSNEALDIEDGVRWMIAQGYTDPNRVCVFGVGLGGYRALMSAIISPDVYRCVISIAGATDLYQLVEARRYFENYDIVKKALGTDRSELAKRSPENLADKISIPVLLVHGDKDRQVNVYHSKRMFKALKQADKRVKLIELEDGDHYLTDGKDRLKAYKAIQTFLRENFN